MLWAAGVVTVVGLGQRLQSRIRDGESAVVQAANRQDLTQKQGQIRVSINW